jgi:hypothetical protein
MSVCCGLGGVELGDLKELRLVSREDIVELGGGPLVMDIRRKLVTNDDVGKVSFGRQRFGIEEKDEEYHLFSEHISEGRHAIGDLLA